jgi:hypothetical protein
MVRMSINVDVLQLEELQYYLAKASAGELSRTAAAMKDGALLIQKRWVGFAGGGELGDLPRLKRPKGGYARSIKTEPRGEFEHEIYSDAKVAEYIENGTEELDMKQTHTRGPRSRVSKKGVPYLIVPFRWGTPGAIGFKNVIPDAVYDIVRNKEFRASSVKVSPNNSNYRTPNAKGEMVGRARYRWGDRLKESDFDGTIKEKSYMNGMVRFENGFRKNGEIKKRYGGYFTFRVISANSPKGSWIKPAMPARHVIAALVKETQGPIEKMVEGAITEDLA